MKLKNLSSPRSKFGKNRANNLNSRMNARRSTSGRSIYSDDTQKKEVTTISEKKFQNLEERYEKALKERNKIYRGQYAADNPLNDVYEAKGDMLDRKLDRLEDEMEVLEKEQDLELEQ